MMFSQLISAMRALMLVISVMSLETAVKMRAMLITYLKELLQELEQDQKKDEDALRPMQMKRVKSVVVKSVAMSFLIRFRERHRGMRMLNCILHMGSEEMAGIRRKNDKRLDEERQVGEVLSRSVSSGTFHVRSLLLLYSEPSCLRTQKTVHHDIRKSTETPRVDEVQKHLS
jgi:hypothetical protein